MAETAFSALKRLIELLDSSVDAEEAARKLTVDGSPGRAFGMSCEDIMALTGMNRRAAEAIDLVDELCRYTGVEKFGPSPVLTDGERAKEYFSALLWGRHVEYCYIACLDKGGRLLRCEQLSRGDVGTSAVYMRDIARAALETGAVYAILAHNHPGGSLVPSREDLEVTAKAEETLALLGTKLLEHYIITSRGCAAILSGGTADAKGKG